jgi:hypothetical protein
MQAVWLALALLGAACVLAGCLYALWVLAYVGMPWS